MPSSANGTSVIKIHGEYVPVRAEVIEAERFSAHADVDDVLAWLAGAPEPAATYVVHGEPAAAATCATELTRNSAGQSSSPPSVNGSSSAQPEPDRGSYAS